MTASENLKRLADELGILRTDAVRLRTKIVQVSNATDWLGTKYEREWLFKAENAINEAIAQLYHAENAAETVRAEWAKKEAKKK